MMTRYMVNGRKTAHVDAGDRGLLYGDGLFETLAVRGGVCEFWGRHLHRLLRGCERLRIAPPIVPQLETEITALTGDLDRAVLKIIVTRGMAGRGYRMPIAAEPTRILLVSDWPEYPGAYAEEGVRVRLCEQRLSRNPRLAGVKHLNRLEQVLAASEWDGQEYAEGLMLDDQGRVIEGTFTNLFLVSGGRLLTPAVDQCGVAGVMRDVVRELAHGLGIGCTESEVGTDMLYEADEAFLTNSLIGIWPIRGVERRMAEPGPVTRRLQAALSERRHNAVGEQHP